MGGRFFWLCHLACRILVPQPGTGPGPPAVEVQSPSHGTTREVLWRGILNEPEFSTKFFDIWLPLDLRGRVVSGPEERSLLPAQELNLGNLEENPES